MLYILGIVTGMMIGCTPDQPTPQKGWLIVYEFTTTNGVVHSSMLIDHPSVRKLTAGTLNLAVANICTMNTNIDPARVLILNAIPLEK